MYKAARDDRGRAVALDRRAGEADGAAAAAQDAGNRRVEGRFARAVRAEHGDDLTIADLKIDAAQDFCLAIASAQGLDREKGVSGHAPLL
jgi:hypothetical protein